MVGSAFRGYVLTAEVRILDQAILRTVVSVSANAALVKAGSKSPASNLDAEISAVNKKRGQLWGQSQFCPQTNLTTRKFSPHLVGAICTGFFGIIITWCK